MRNTIFKLLFLMLITPQPVLAMITPDIAFVRKPLNSTPGFDSFFDVYTIDINGGNLVRLTNNDYAELDPIFSPTDDLFSFYANPLGTLGGGVFRMDFDGSNVQELSGPGGGYEQSWSPDGTKLVFSKPNSTPGDTDLYIVNKDGSGLVKISQDDGQHLAPKWSPAGDHIAYVSITGTHIVDTNGLNKVTVSSDSDYHALWSPDGTKLYFSNEGGLWSIHPDGTGASKIWSLPDPDFFAAFRVKALTSDGKTLVFTDKSAGPFSTSDSLIFLNLETLDVQTLILDGYNLSNPDLSWSQDGRYLIFRSFDQATFAQHIFRYDAVTKDIFQLTSGDFVDSKVHLRPSYAFLSDEPIGSSAVPEPATLLLLGSGLMGAAIRRKKILPVI